MIITTTYRKLQGYQREVQQSGNLRPSASPSSLPGDRYRQDHQDLRYGGITFAFTTAATDEEAYALLREFVFLCRKMLEKNNQ